MDTIRVAKIFSNATLPTRKHSTDAGMDFYAYGDYLILRQQEAIIRTGISVEVPEGYMLLIKPKGSNSHLVGSGVVDAHYEPGEILIRVVNYTEYGIFITDDDPIAQGVLMPVVTPEIVEVPLEDFQAELYERSGKGTILDHA